eukprot:181246_1
MTSEIQNDSNHFGMWSYIKNTRATESAELKVLQQFMLSLSKESLRYLICIYIKSKLKKHDRNDHHLVTLGDHIYNHSSEDNDDGGTTMSTIQYLHADTNPMDTEIFSKMKQHYSNTYDSMIMDQISQQSHPSQHILSALNPQLLAYSFQFLSYKELCQSEVTCNYFLYASRTYKGLSHHYINITHKFMLSVFRNELNWNNLSQFKHICIHAAYFGNLIHRHQCYKTVIFDQLLHTIIRKSISCLHTLEIDVKLHFGRINILKQPMNTLFNILYAFETANHCSIRIRTITLYSRERDCKYFEWFDCGTK